jgi:hypothetical protein
LNPNIKGSSLTLVESEDKHKLTIVRSDDLLPSESFEMWHACRDAYLRQVTDPHRGIPAAELHIFPAEINACHYESVMPQLLKQNYRTLHPEVVALLEDREKFEMFFRAIALDFIRLEEREGQPYWVYKLPDDKETIHITVPAETLDGRYETDIFQVIHNFVMEGRDQRPGYGNALLVDWGKLRKTILAQQRKLGKSPTTKLYRDQIHKGVVKTIKDDVERRRARIADEKQRKMIGQEMDDLGDLAQVVYLNAIESVKSIG